MKLEHDRFTVHPRVPFAIARGSTSEYERVRVRLQDGHEEGWGEAAPNAFYEESAETVVAALPRLAQVMEQHSTIDSLEHIEAIEGQMRKAVVGNASARSAISAAAHDLLGKRMGEPLWKLFGLEPMTVPPSSFTIAISTVESDLVRRVEEARRYPILKVKLGTDRDEWIVNTVRRVLPNHILRADANGAWSVKRAIEMTRFLESQGFELIEQPLPSDDLDGFRQLKRWSPLPIVADESCLTAQDIPLLAGAADAINIKLSKCGGLAEARHMIHAARRRDLRVMIGCMVESSLGITAAAHLAPLADYVDLDGAALLADDPYVGVTIDDGLVRLPSGPGLGVVRR